MQAAPLPDDLRLHAPALAARLAEIIARLIGFIAHSFLRDPRLVRHSFTLTARLCTLRRVFATLMQRVANGRPSPTRRTTTRRAPPRDTLPRRRAWLLAALRHEGALIGIWLADMLAQPETARLIAATPRAGALLRPLCGMLGVETPLFPRRQRTRISRPAPSPPADRTVLPATVPRPARRSPRPAAAPPATPPVAGTCASGPPTPASWRERPTSGP